MHLYTIDAWTLLLIVVSWAAGCGLGDVVPFLQHSHLELSAILWLTQL